MTTGSISSEKIDLLIYGPVRPILENGFSDHFVVHKAETRGDLERLTPAIREKIRGVAVTYHTVRADRVPNLRSADSRLVPATSIRSRARS